MFFNQCLQSVAEAAEDIWDRYGHDFGTNYSGLFKALSHIDYNVRLAAAEALATALDEKPDTIQVSITKLRFFFFMLFSNFLLISSGISFYFIFFIYPGCWFW